MQQQRIENRMDLLQVKHPKEIRAIAAEYVEFIKKVYDYSYQTRKEFEEGLKFLYNTDKTLDKVEIGQLKL